MTDKLLLVDDNEISRDFLTRRFQRQGYTVTAASNGRDALALIHNETFDIVLLDLEIPVVSGLEVLRETRKRYQPIELPIIVITAQQETRIIVQAFEAGASDCVSKPVDFGVVNARIRTHIALRRAEAASRETEERYTLAVTGSNDGIWDWNLQTNTAFFSERWKSMLGYQHDEIGSQPDEWFDRIHMEDRESVKAALTAHLKGKASHFESEHRVLHRDGSYRWMLSRGVAVRDEEEKPCRIAGSQTDITTAKVTDPLTGLPNRALFLDRLSCLLERAKRHRDLVFAVLFLDIDRFKEINDSLGHLAGDQLLLTIAQRLQQCLRASDSMTHLSSHTVARLGGDEFTVILNELSGPADAMRIAERLMQTIKEPIRIGTHELHVGVSIGIALNCPETPTSKDMLAKADTAMYSAKTHGRNRIEMFSPSMRSSAVARIQLEQELRRGIDRGEFFNWYQFIVCLKTGRITGIEALVRWNHPTRGVVCPDEFMETAEQTGLIVPIGSSVMAQACWDLTLLQKEHCGDKPLTVSVNLSGVQFAQRELAQQVQRILSETGVEPSCLKLEITESVMADPDASEETLRRLKALGVSLEIDDFGTGYSSLGYLAGYPVDALKVDRSFVTGLEDNPKKFEITRTIIGLAHNLGLEVVAEGIETEEQQTLLRVMGCEYGQGYLISQPQDIAAAREFIAHRMRPVGVPA
jgi:diguanylate cyclase (GGDEF)-like protein/PAS domain S-box-containing protein